MVHEKNHIFSKLTQNFMKNHNYIHHHTYFMNHFIVNLRLIRSNSIIKIKNNLIIIFLFDLK